MPMRKKTVIGDRIREERIKLRISQAALGKLVGVSQSQISKYESYEDLPTDPTAEALAGVLHTTYDYLLGETENVLPDVPNLECYRQEIEKHRIPVLGRIAAGDKVIAIEDIVDMIDTSTTGLPRW